MTRWRAVLPLVPLSLAGVAATGSVPWEDLTPADLLHDVVTRVTSVDGHRVYYPTPTRELATALEGRSEPDAARELAEARFALGERPAALAALRRWAEAAGPEAWAEAARWAAERLEMPFAFEAAERALAGLAPDDARSLHDERILWADRHPAAADALALRRARALAFPADANAFEDYLRALDAAKRFDDAEAALAATTIVAPERRLILRSDLLADRGEARRAFDVLDGGIDAGFGPDYRKAFAERADAGAPELPARWRGQLEQGFDAAALKRLATYFQGQGRGDAAADLLREIERREERRSKAGDLHLMARLWSEIDATPEAFRAALSASQAGSADEQTAALAPLARLALRSGGRALAWGTYNDEPYRWAARLDRTPGFWTGGLSFLLTGQDWKEALAHLESESVPERTFATARLLHDELVRRSPGSPDLPALRAALMERHVERGEGKQALSLLPLVEPAGGPAADDARRIALLALRQVDGPIAEEARLFKARLRHAAGDGSKPSLTPPAYSEYEVAPDESWRRLPAPDDANSYRQLLDDAVNRLDQRDPSHHASVALLLGEMDRMPQAESLWLELAQRLEGWNLDDELGPRYEQALARFRGPGWWPAAARWYARHARARDLDRLANELASGFRGAALFERLDATVRLALPEQPRVGQRVRLAPWADWVRLKALERFPHSSRVYREAVAHLQRQSSWDAELARRGAASLEKERGSDRVVVPDALLDERAWAVLVADPAERELYFARAMKAGDLEARLATLEAAEATPVRDRLLFEGWARLSRFEGAAAAADRLAAAYPGDEPLARSVLSLQRSLAGLDPAHAEPARSLVARTAPALVDAAPLWTELGELEEERGRPEAALGHWRHILENDPRNPDRISELATLLWDYNHMAEALDVVEQGRKRLEREHFFAFETGVLREETRDIRGAVREYLDALLPEGSACYCSAFETDQRSLRRLAQLLGRPRVFSLIEADIAALTPGRADDERRLAALLPLATITAPEPGLDWDADDWIDQQDQPNDPVGRSQRDARRQQARPDENAAIGRIAERLLAKAESLVPAATTVEFAEALESWARPLLEARDAERAISFEIASLRRRAALAASPGDRVTREIQLASRLVSVGRPADADAVWSALPARLRALPEGAARMHAEAAYPQHLESERRTDAADAAWRELGARYSWSLGVLQDRLAFLDRAGRGDEARRTLESAVPAMAAGHRERFLAQLTREALEAGDRSQARRGVEALLKETALDPQERLGADHLLARLALKENAAFDPASLAASEGPKLPKELLPDLYAQLAQAAEREQAWATGTSLWIEALNRRLERAWLASACTAATRAGRLPELLRFFETQQQRSPRDVRWAVAVREIRRHADDAAGAIEAAKAAVAVKPDRELLWREAADLMVRADRVREAADYLEGWNAPRRADESVVAWRGRLYARVGDGSKALALERGALAAYARERPDDGDELQERTARAARRLIEYGYPQLALRLLAPAGETAKLAGSRLGEREKADLALANGQFLRLLRDQRESSEFLEAAGQALRDSARPEQRDEATAWFLRQLFPTPGGPGDSDRLEALWPTVEAASLDRVTRLAVGERLARETPGPWQAAASAAFHEAVGAAAIVQLTEDGESVWRFQPPTFDRLWAHELVRRDRDAELAAFLDARFMALLGQAESTAPLPAGDAALREWTGWLGDRAGLEVWARGLRQRPETLAALARTFSRRRSWDRLWATGGKRWDVAPLVALLPDPARAAWFAFWDAPASGARSPIEERVSVAVGRLVTGDVGAESDPLVVRLRGPRTVGESLAPGREWQWPELGADAPQWPAVLWGGDPGESWFALETLARLRGRDADAARVPLESPQRGKETQRALLAARLAERLGDDAFASETLEAHASSDATLFATRLRLLTRLGRTAEAGGLFAAKVKTEQSTLGEDGLRALEALAASLELKPPLESFDPTAPVAPALLAYLHDARGAGAAARFHTDDPVGFRAALARRFEGRSASLSADQVRFSLHELWANGAGELPRAGLRRLGGLWPHAAEWLARQAPADRAAALAAVAALPDTRLAEELSRERGVDQQDTTRLLLLRGALARHDVPAAQGLFDAMLAALDEEEPLTYTSADVLASESDEGEWEEGEAESTEGSESDSGNALAAQLEAWREAFKEARQEALVDERLAAFLRTRRDNGFVPIAEWRLAFRVAGGDAQRLALDKGLEHAWLRGDWAPEGLAELVEMLAEQAPALAPRWLARWPASVAYAETARRVRILARLEDKSGAATLLAQTRSRVLWSAQDEVRAFDSWRRLTPDIAPGPAPAAWTAAAAFWKKPADQATNGLEAHLRAHPCDLLAARAILRSVQAVPEEAAQRARVALAAPALDSLGSVYADDTLVRLRVARGLLPVSAPAARTVLASVNARGLTDDLVRRRFRAADIDAALADVARLATRGADATTSAAVLAVLDDRKAAGLVALRAELASLRGPEPAPAAFRMDNGRPRPWRPRDLDFALVARVLDAEGQR
jgi:hypothetical protein